MSLRGVQRRSNLLVLVDTERDGEIAAASLGWPRNDIGAAPHLLNRAVNGNIHDKQEDFLKSLVFP